MCDRAECFQVSEVHVSGLEAAQAEEITPTDAGKATFGVLYKKGISTINTLRVIKRILGVKTIGYGGLKDTHAISWQFISIEGKVNGFSINETRFIPISTRYTHMSTREVWGNSFFIHLVDVNKPLILTNRFVKLCEKPIPAYYGPQRFGKIDNDTHLVGMHILKKDYQKAINKILDGKNGWYEALLQKSLNTAKNDEQALLSLPNFILRLFINAYQAHVFNRALKKFYDLAPFSPATKIMVAPSSANGLPIEAKTELINGDTANKVDYKRQYFMGLLPGTDLEKSVDEFGRIETEVLIKDGLTPNDFKTTLLGNFRGSKRQLYFWVVKPQYLLAKKSLWLRFKLHRGMYATVVLSILADFNPQEKFPNLKLL
ncbi:MAG: tRNA pseudouridine(13) synthase TruD [Thermoprotei archaeon]